MAVLQLSYREPAFSGQNRLEQLKQPDCNSLQDSPHSQKSSSHLITTDDHKVLQQDKKVFQQAIMECSEENEEMPPLENQKVREVFLSLGDFVQVKGSPVKMKNG